MFHLRSIRCQRAKENGIPFPRVLPLVDKANPFFMDLVLAGFHKSHLGENVHVRLEYQDTAGDRPLCGDPRP